MGGIDRIIMIRHAVETLGYFSMQLASEFRRMGLAVYFVDFARLADTVGGIGRFAAPGRTALCTFNFIGLSGEEIFLDENGVSVWERYGMTCFNIMVDHPLYYHARLADPPAAKLYVFCIDRGHRDYVKRFYPDIRVDFLPLAGNVRLHGQGGDENQIPYEKRKYDLVFTGNYTPTEQFYRRLDELEPDYRSFYRGVIDDLTKHPSETVEAVAERHILRELGEVSPEEMRGAIAGMVLADICVRSCFRGKIISHLAESGIKVHVFGADWDKLPCKKPENLISSGKVVDSAACVEAVSDARLALNIMPWFKDGVHDRVFTAMLQRAVPLTDRSLFLEERFTDGKNIAFYDLVAWRELPEIVRGLLAEPERAQRLAAAGYEAAVREHTWQQRAAALAEYF